MHRAVAKKKKQEEEIVVEGDQISSIAEEVQQNPPLPQAPPVQLGGIRFNDAKALYDWIQQLQNVLDHKAAIQGAQLQVLLALIGCHPKAKQMIGSGIERIYLYVVKPGDRCLIINRYNGTTVQFNSMQITKCIQNIFHNTTSLPSKEIEQKKSREPSSSTSSSSSSSSSLTSPVGNNNIRSMEEGFNELLNRGFSGDIASQVLRESNGDLNIATTKLLEMNRLGQDVYESEEEEQEDDGKHIGDNRLAQDLTRPHHSSSSSSSSSSSVPQNMYCQMQSCHPFKTHYVRNNRRSTEKNLRCFPCCNIDGHVIRGFCGRGLKQKVILTDACLDIIGRNTNPLTKVTCVVELTMYNEFPENRPVLGSVYKPQDIWSRLKISKTNTKEPWTRPYWKGVIDETEEVLLKLPTNEIDFLFRPSHWHYGWRSNKFTNATKHTCRMYVFVEMNDHSLLW